MTILSIIFIRKIRFSNFLMYFVIIILCSTKCHKFNFFNIAKIDSNNEMEQNVYNHINQYRESLNLEQLQWNEAIAMQCRLHSQQMAQGNVVFSHLDYNKRLNVLKNTIVYISIAENVARNKGYSDPSYVAFESWLNSSKHRESIEGDYNLTGVGVYIGDDRIYYFTQIFVNDPYR